MFKTLVYADIFDYPLTLDEIHRWWIAGDKGSDPIVKTNGYYHLRGREKLVSLRRRRAQVSQVKLKKLKLIIRIFKIIPFIKLVCVTGALAMNNSDKDDDIDLMIVTAKNRLWLTRLIVLLLLLPWLRRGKKINNRICLNLWLDAAALAVKRRDLYIAHEICQARSVFERDNYYNKFITANLWYKKYLPNWTN